MPRLRRVELAGRNGRARTHRGRTGPRPGANRRRAGWGRTDTAEPDRAGGGPTPAGRDRRARPGARRRARRRDRSSSLGGEPGIGKSTLLLQAAAGIAGGSGRGRWFGRGSRAVRDGGGVDRPGPPAGRAARAPRPARPANGSTSSPRARSSGSSSLPRTGRRPWSSWTRSRPPPSTSSTDRPAASDRSASRRSGSWSWPRARVSRSCSSAT